MSDHGVVYRNEDSYCGPISKLVMLPDEELLVVFREAKRRDQVAHADPTTRMNVLRSRDRGRTWFSLVTADPAGGNGCSIMRMRDGTLLANAFHWLFVPKGQEEKLGSARYRISTERLGMTCACGGVYQVRSETDGYTWSAPRRIPEPGEWPGLACHSPPVELPGGDLLLPVTGTREGETSHHGVVLRSLDHGVTWDEPLCLTGDIPGDVHFHETRLVVCPSGRIVAMHRTPDGNYWRNESVDRGASWSPSEETPIWCGGSSPPDMLVLADGRLLLTRGYRREPFGVRAYLSEDEGRTWDLDGQIILRDDGLDRDVGYPTTVQFRDGGLLTVYYWHGEDQLRHLQCTTWSLADRMPRAARPQGALI